MQLYLSLVRAERDKDLADVWRSTPLEEQRASVAAAALYRRETANEH